MYHYKLLCWLFVVAICSGTAIQRTGENALWYKTKALKKRRESCPSTSVPPVWWRYVGHFIRGNVTLLLVVLLSTNVWSLALYRSPDYSQPAIAAPAHCFMSGRRAHPFNGRMRRDFRPLVVVAVGVFAPVIARGFAYGVVFMLSFVQPDIERRGDDDEINERDSRRKRLLRRLQAVEAVIYIVCNAIAIAFAFRERSKAQEHLDPETSERVWGFGQITALVLLGAPVLVFFEVVIG